VNIFFFDDKFSYFADEDKIFFCLNFGVKSLIVILNLFFSSLLLNFIIKRAQKREE
jgi:hypothetical protein